MRPLRLTSVSCTMAVLLTTAGCGPQQAAPTPPGPAPAPSRAAGEMPDEKGRRAVAPVTNCPTRSGDTATATGTELLATTLRYSASSFRRDVALSAESLAKLPEALSTDAFLDMDHAYLNGAFAAGGAFAQVAFENTGSGTISVYDVRPVNIVVECVPLAALIAYGNEGGDPAEMVFSMDAAAPMAWASDERGQLVGPYFEEFPSINLGAKEKQNFLFTFLAETGAYTFELLVSYEQDGRKANTLLRNGLVPFRVTTSLCPSQDARLAMSEPEVRHMRSLRYENVRSRHVLEPAVESPDEWARDCPTW